MGACHSKQFEPPKARTLHYIEPSDTQSLKDVTLPTLSFSGLISDIKIKKCEHKYIGLKFKIDGLHQYVATVKETEAGNKIYWKINNLLNFYLSEYQIRKKFLEITAYNRNLSEVLGEIKINLFHIWTGPYHLDFSFELKNNPLCRLSFNFKISQGIHLKIENLSTQMIPTSSKAVGEKFTFMIGAIVGQQTDTSNHAYAVRINDQADLKNKNNNSLIKEDLVLETQFVESDNICWKQSKNKQLHLPFFEKKIKFYEIYSSSLHLIFWKVLPGLENPDEPRYEMDSECYISIAKLFSFQYKIIKDSVTMIQYYERMISLEEKLWLHGLQVGKVKINLKFTIQAHQKQMQAGVRTENGILTSSPVFSNMNSNLDKQCDEIVNLKRIHIDTQQEFIDLSQNSKEKNNFIIINKHISTIKGLLLKTYNILNKTSKQSLMFFEYKNEIELLKGQQILIDISYKIIKYLHEDNAAIEEICYKILSVLLKRGEFKLSHMGFSKEEKSELENNNVSVYLEHKIEVCLKYQQLLNQLLKEALIVLEFKGEMAERSFAQQFCAYSYFRIPLFREHILSVIKKIDDPEIPEWRGTQFDLYHDNSNQNGQFYSRLFDWENNFYKCLSKEEKYTKYQRELSGILFEDKWKTRLAKRSGAFFSFFINLINQVEYVSVVSKYITWQYLPGYSKLLHVFLVEMKNTRIIHYSESFKRCMDKLISNERLLNIFIVILMKKTNVNEPESAYLTFTIIDSLFNQITTKSRAIAGTFDYKFFIEGIKIVLEGEYQFVISQVLVLIYHHFNLFSVDFVEELSLFLLGQVFYKLFFSWSYNLRHIFHSLIYARIYSFSIKNTKKSTSLDPLYSANLTNVSSVSSSNLKFALTQRYQFLMNNLKTQVQFQNANLNLAKRNVYEKQLYKKMKYNLSDKKRKRYEKNNSDYSLERQIPRSLGQIMSENYSQKVVNIPRKMKYITEGQSSLAEITPIELVYYGQSVDEFQTIKEELDKRWKINPEYIPNISSKNIVDEKELKPNSLEEW